MKLQIKDSGAWRNVVSFDDAQQMQVEHAGLLLMRAIDSPKVSMRIVRDTPQQKVESYCTKEDGVWHWRVPGYH